MEASAHTPDPHRWQALTVVCVAFFMTVLDVSIVNVALPSIKNSLHVGESSLQWVLIAYTITFGGLLLLGGRAADLLGRRRMFMIGTGAVRRCVTRVRARRIDGCARRRTRGSGNRRCDHLAGDAVDHHDDVRRRGRAEQGTRYLGCDGRQRRRGRCVVRRDSHEVRRLGMGVLRERAGRRARAPGDALGRPREPHHRHQGLRRRGRDDDHHEPRAARLRDLEGSRRRLGQRPHDRPPRRRGRPARRVRPDRDAAVGPDGAVQHLPDEDRDRCERRGLPARGGRVLELLPADAVRAAGAGLLGAEDRPHLPRDGGHGRAGCRTLAGARHEDRTASRSWQAA